MTLQNGIGNDKIISEYIDKSRILIGTSEHNSTLKNKGTVCHGGNGITVIGNIEDNFDVLENIKVNFIKCGIETIISDNIQKIIWKKLLLNASVNAITAIYKIPTGRITEEKIMKICSNIITESIDIAESEGIIFSFDETMQNICSLAERQKNAYTSMYNDIKNGRKTEIDFINGAIAEIACKNNINARYNNMITEQIHQLEMKGF
jgi:2-dehydropantoate 2-reductase